jgi:hypothetical protein
MMMTQDRLSQVLTYDPATGIFRWHSREPGDGDDPAKVATWNTRYAGRVAGVRTHGYIKISIGDRKYYAHRLAWLYVFGRMPTLLDHINRDGCDNRIENLRAADKRINVDNSFRKDNTTGFRGVIRSANGQKFIAQRKHFKGQSSYIGTFDTAEAAHEAYMCAVRGA